MYKIIIAIVAAVVIGWVLFQGSTMNYVMEVNDDVAMLEAELIEIDAALSTGALTPEEAAKAQLSIATRINAINKTTSAGLDAKLTDAQRVQLVGGLDRLQKILIKYQATFVAVDNAVLSLPEEKRPTLKYGNGGHKNVAALAAEAVAVVEDQVTEFIDTIEDEDLSSELSEDVTAEEELPVITEEGDMNQIPDTSGDAVDVESTTTVEDTVLDGEATVDLESSVN